MYKSCVCPQAEKIEKMLVLRSASFEEFLQLKNTQTLEFVFYTTDPWTHELYCKLCTSSSAVVLGVTKFGDVHGD